MLIAILSGFLSALFLLFFGKRLKSSLSLITSLLPIGLFAYFLSFLPQIRAGNSVYYSLEWVPSLGVNLDFKLDGLSLLFSLLITGIGALVFLYSTAYMKGHMHIGKFYSYLSIFMASMLGLVLSDNVLLLFVFWE